MMRKGAVLALAFGLGITVTVAEDLVDFPATGELDVVFPRNKTYAVEAPFPVILGFQNAPVLLSFATQIKWNVDCAFGTLWGTGYLDGERGIAPSSDPYFWVNGTDTLAKTEDGDDQFEYWRSDHDTCTLGWEILFYTTCEREADGSLRIMSNYFQPLTGNVTFTLRPGATSPQDAIANYDGCAVAGTNLNIKSNETGCAQIADDPVTNPKPCDLDVEGVASSLANAIPTPTTSLTSVSTTSSTDGATETGSGSASETSSGGSGGDGAADSSDDDSGADSRLYIGSRVMTLTYAVFLGVVLPHLL